ncbi:hypothetical protein FNV43_RR14061 [Rhamnella rubrinervis]|uniref:V-type proton ATPase subunit S1/VOA1 transmembrane domain-containing protein n=1 Tax=Rhamnella rubrinervis TaxID=2594499 RepID=A0A8K0H2B4_9ROSA|nr:hypothetical protein FNV43_RR14061 [Rhamnella rubrinervis]
MKAALPLLPLLRTLLVAAVIPYGFSLPSFTVPAFLWSPHYNHPRLEASVNYQTITPKDLAKSVLSQGGWSKILCSGNKLKQPVDLALVFVGRELQSLDIFANKHADGDLVDLLKVAYTESNFSMAVPYIAASEEETIANSLLAGFMEICGPDIFINAAFSQSCSLGGGNFQKLANLHSVHEYVVSRMERRTKGEADLVVFCHDRSESLKEVEQSRSESEVFSELINLVDQSGAKYAALYVTDPFGSIQYPSHHDIERFLAEGASGKANSTICDEVCQIKSSLLEGLFVGIVLLIILISGICCMMGIDTPTRFETPQES